MCVLLTDNYVMIDSENYGWIIILLWGGGKGGGGLKKHLSTTHLNTKLRSLTNIIFFLKTYNYVQILCNV